jgi:NitT/TauT family transport system substrate-binding protein
LGSFSVIARRAFLAGAAATAAALRPQAARTATLTPVNVSSSLEDDAAALLYGMHSGIFAKHGLEVNLQPASVGAAAAAAIAGGSLQFAKSSTLAMAAGYLRGVPFTIVAPSTLSTAAVPIAGLLVRPDSPIRTGRDCAGRTFATSGLHDLKSLSIMAWVDQTGGDAKSLKLIEIPSPATLEAIVDGRVDGTAISNPVLYDAVTSGQARDVANPFDAISKRFVASAWFTTTQYAASSPDVVRGFVLGLRESARYAMAHPAEMADVLAPFLHDDIARLRKMNRTTVGLTLDPHDYQPVIDAAAKYGILARSFPAPEFLTMVS